MDSCGVSPKVCENTNKEKDVEAVDPNITLSSSELSLDSSSELSLLSTFFFEGTAVAGFFDAVGILTSRSYRPY